MKRLLFSRGALVLIASTVDPKSIHTPVKTAGFCHVIKKKKKNENKKNHVKTFSAFIVKLQLLNHRKEIDFRWYSIFKESVWLILT